MSKAPRKAKGSVRAKLGLPAKAGRRKQYGPLVSTPDGRMFSGRRKTKDWSTVGHGYSMKDSDPDGLIFREHWKGGDSVLIPQVKHNNTNLYNLTQVELDNRKKAVQQMDLRN